MAHFAHVKNGVVDQVIVIEQEVLDEHNGWHCPACGEHRPKEEWIQTSYNTYHGQHKQGGQALRKNFAGIGYTYDNVKDAFIPPNPHPGQWVLDEQKCDYVPPVPLPPDANVKDYGWSEKDGGFVEKKPEESLAVKYGAIRVEPVLEDGNKITP